jgi:hypothetical protein
MKNDLNKYMFVIPIGKEFANEPFKYKLANIFNFNTLDFTLFTKYKRNKPNQNILEKNKLIEYGYNIEYDLTLKVAVEQISKEQYLYVSYYPYSMRQAFFLYKQGVDIYQISQLYNFSEDEIKNGFSIKKGLKKDFYPQLLEETTSGLFYFDHRILELPEFIGDVALNNINSILN